MELRHDYSQRFTITLELLPATPADNDPALLYAMLRDTVDALQHDGYEVTAPYTGQRGGELLIEISQVWTTLMTAVNYAWAHRAAAEELLNDGSALVTICVAAVPVIHKIRHAHEKRVGKEESTANPVKITLVIDGSPIQVESADLEQTEAALALAIKAKAMYPIVAARVTPKSHVQVKGHVPNKKRRSRR